MLPSLHRLSLQSARPRFCAPVGAPVGAPEKRPRLARLADLTPRERAEGLLANAEKELNRPTASRVDLLVLQENVSELAARSDVPALLRQKMLRTLRSLKRALTRSEEQVPAGTDAPGDVRYSYGVRSQQQSASGAADEEMLEEDEYLVERLLDRRTVTRNRRPVTQWLVRWAEPFNTEQWDTWEPETNIYNNALIEEYERRVAGDRGGDDDDGGGGDGGDSSEHDYEDEEPGGGDGGYDVSKLLVYDTNTSTIKTSLTLILQSVTAPVPDWLSDVLEELVVTALWRLECVRVRESEMSSQALNELLDELQKVNKDSLDAEFDTMGRNPGRGPVAKAKVLTRKDFDAAKRADARRRIEQRASASRVSTNVERERLLDLLQAIDAVKDLEGGKPRPSPSGRSLVEQVLDQRDAGAKWWLFFLRPTLRIHQQNQLIRYRGPETQRWLDWLRGRLYPTPRPSQRATDLLGSAYTGVIPQLVTSATVPVEHVVPQSWYGRAAHLKENGTPREDACGVVLATKAENAQKSNRPVYFGSPNGDLLTATPDSSVWQPADAATFWTPGRRALVARCVVYSFLTYFMTGEGSANGWTAIDESTGSQYYKAITDLLVVLCQVKPGPIEKLNARVLSDKVSPSWRNPLVFHAADLLGAKSTNALAPRFRELLRKRLAGDTKVPTAVATALRGKILGLPTV